MAEDNPLRSPLPADALVVIDFVHAFLRDKGRWPIGDYVAGSLGRRIDLDELVRSLPMLGTARYGPILQSGGGFVDLAEPLKVTIAGLAQIPGASGTVASVLGLIVDLAERYVALPPDPNRPVEMHQSWSDLSEVVHKRTGGDSKLDVDIALAVFACEPPGWGSYRLGDKPADITWEVSRSLAWYAGLKSVEDYLDLITRRLGWAPGTALRAPAVGPSSSATPPLGIDPGVWREVGPAVTGERWGEVIRSAGLYLEEVVRAASGLPTTLNPKDLMGRAFGSNGSLQLGNPEHANEAIGWRELAQGFIAAVRNPGTHVAAGGIVERANGAMAIVSMLVSEIRKLRPDIFDDDGILRGETSRS